MLSGLVPALSGLARADHTRDIPDGTLLFLYTDGLVEHHPVPSFTRRWAYDGWVSG